ncbi:unnamed protein product [Peronospora destructor]|uniref:Ankyrin repeat-containing domain n=1 Tax=Peronospora destructor TaxID=86335 RepID=A0AAV0UG44_9STRA|nr:unnamed protein product [Peronospora destructor]
MVRPSPSSFPLLTSVAFVYRQYPHIEALDQVTGEFDELLDYSQLWTLDEACHAGLEHLVERIVARDANKIQCMDKLLCQALATSAMASAAASGHVYVLRRLATSFPRARVTKTVEIAATNGHVKMLQWLYQQHQTQILDVLWGARELLMAVRNGHLEVAQWLIQHTTPPEHQFLIDEAARNGDLVMIQWLYSISTSDEWTVNAVVNAA